MRTSLNTKFPPFSRSKPSSTTMGSSPLQSPTPISIVPPQTSSITTLAVSKEPTSVPIPQCPSSSTTNPQETKGEASGSQQSKKRKQVPTAQESSILQGVQQRSKKQMIGYAINKEWYDATDFPEFKVIIAKQNWEFLLTDCACENLYPELMNEFIKNFRCNKGDCTSLVNGVVIHFDAKILGSWFRVPCEGFQAYLVSSKHVSIDGKDEDVVMEFVSGESGETKTDHKTLTPLQKLLYNLARRAIVPRPKKRNEVTLQDASLIYCLSNQIPINFPALMITHLKHSINKRSTVGYGALLTRIFKLCKVKVDNISSIALSPDQFINEKSLRGLNLCVEGGKMCFVSQVSVPKQKAYASATQKEDALDEGEQEDNEEEVPQLVWLRKSARLAFRRRPRVVYPTLIEIIGITEEETDDKNNGMEGQELPQSPLVPGHDGSPALSPFTNPLSSQVPIPPPQSNPNPVPSSTTPSPLTSLTLLFDGAIGSTVVGFASFSSKTLTMEQLLKEVIDQMKTHQEHLLMRLDSVEAKVDKVTQDVAVLSREVQGVQAKVLEKIDEISVDELVEETVVEETEAP